MKLPLQFFLLTTVQVQDVTNRKYTYIIITVIILFNVGQTIGISRQLERAVWFDKLPKIFKWYETIIDKFVGKRKSGKYKHRILKLRKKMYWEVQRCPEAGIEAQEQAIAGLNEIGFHSRSGNFSNPTGFDVMYENLAQMMVDQNYLKQVSDDFEYEVNDDFETPLVQKTIGHQWTSRGRRKKHRPGNLAGNRPGNRPGKKPGKNAQWMAITDTKNRELAKVQKYRETL